MLSFRLVRVLSLFSCLFLFLFYAESLFASSASAFGAVSDDELRVKNPCTVRCFSPSMVEFLHRDNGGSPVLSIRGEIGESLLYKTLELYADRVGEIEIFKTGNAAGQGFDFAMIDRKNRLVIFLEAKDMASSLGRHHNRLVSPEIDRSETLDPVKIKMEAELKSSRTDRTDQLSRRWCYNRLKELTSIYPAQGEAFNYKSLGEDGYKFMRVISLTVIDTRACHQLSQITIAAR